jgi:hypothetical protein
MPTHALWLAREAKCDLLWASIFAEFPDACSNVQPNYASLERCSAVIALLDDANHAFHTIHDELQRLAALVHRALNAAISQHCKNSSGGSDASSFGPHVWQKCMSAGLQPMQVMMTATATIALDAALSPSLHSTLRLMFAPQVLSVMASVIACDERYAGN